MKSRNRLYLSILMFVSVASYASTNRTTLYFLSTDAFSGACGLGDFPAANTSASDADLQTVLSYQNSRTTDDCTRASSEASITLEAFFGPAYGPLSETEVTRFDSFFQNVLSDTDHFASIAKNYFERPRPFAADSSVKPCIPETSPKTSYPSEHATISRLFADALSKIDPTRQQAFMDRADQIALDRVIGGVHYPTDIAAGKEFGDAIFAQMENNSDFQGQLSELSSK